MSSAGTRAIQSPGRRNFPSRSNCESLVFMSLQRAASPGLPLHPWSQLRPHDSLGSSSQAPGVESVSCWHLDPWCHRRRSRLAGHVLRCYVQDVCPRESPAPAAKVKPEPRLQPADFKMHVGKSRGLLEVKQRQPQLPEPQGPSSAVTPEKQPQLASAVFQRTALEPSR